MTKTAETMTLKEFRGKYLSPIKGDKEFLTGFAEDWQCEFEYNGETWEWASWDRAWKVYQFHRAENGKAIHSSTSNDDELVTVKPLV